MRIFKKSYKYVIYQQVDIWWRWKPETNRNVVFLKEKYNYNIYQPLKRSLLSQRISKWNLEFWITVSGLCLVPRCSSNRCGSNGRCIKPNLCLCEGGKIAGHCGDSGSLENSGTNSIIKFIFYCWAVRSGWMMDHVVTPTGTIPILRQHIFGLFLTHSPALHQLR